MVDSIGWLAAFLSLLSCSRRRMGPLRLAAIGSNVCFIAYGLAAELMPVVMLHLVLLPCNIVRLAGMIADGAGPCARTAGPRIDRRWPLPQRELDRLADRVRQERSENLRRILRSTPSARDAASVRGQLVRSAADG